ncbi:MAG: hypothetical protein AB9842_01250 [Bacteroidales bacterium]
MLKSFLQGINGVDLFGIVSTIIFFAFFMIMVIHTLKMKKEDASRHSHLPLEEDHKNSNNINE